MIGDKFELAFDLLFWSMLIPYYLTWLQELFHCHGIRKLGVSDNELQSIPAAIASLVNLEELDISKNGTRVSCSTVGHLVANLYNFSFIECDRRSIFFKKSENIVIFFIILWRRNQKLSL